MSNWSKILDVVLYHPKQQNIKFEQFMIRFDTLTQKRYEWDLIRPEIETQRKRYEINPKLNMWCD